MCHSLSSITHDRDRWKFFETHRNRLGREPANMSTWHCTHDGLLAATDSIQSLNGSKDEIAAWDKGREYRDQSTIWWQALAVCIHWRQALRRARNGDKDRRLAFPSYESVSELEHQPELTLHCGRASVSICFSSNARRKGAVPVYCHRS